ncbi:MAG: FAD-dependent oxidoreductase [Planctomycetes bacterium]|nr:FAD-dependent oxidoreductase [Planctomycetota bacterium]MCB9828262.1 FAD-dependent oxidoreductase [Planctomycetota bacterium]MCB9901426.1 FAD-dependent oxidoreductase [Planctomycetota bacterium]
MSDDVPWIRARVADVRQETPLDRTLFFELDPEVRRAFVWQPGQHITVRLPDEVPPKPRPYSLSGADGPGRPVRITVRNGGSWGLPVYERPIGTVVDLSAPRGAFDLDVPAGDDAVLVAGGSGVAPFRALVEAWVARGAGGHVTLLQASRQRDHLVFADEWSAWERDVPGFTWRPTVTGPDDAAAWPGARGRFGRDALKASLRDPRRTVVAACGPKDLVADTMAWARELGVPEDRCRKEAW